MRSISSSHRPLPRLPLFLPFGPLLPFLYDLLRRIHQLIRGQECHLKDLVQSRNRMEPQRLPRIGAVEIEGVP